MWYSLKTYFQFVASLSTNTCCILSISHCFHAVNHTISGEIPERIICFTPLLKPPHQLSIFLYYPSFSPHVCIICPYVYSYRLYIYILYQFSHMFYPSARKTNNDVFFLTYIAPSSSSGLHLAGC